MLSYGPWANCSPSLSLEWGTGSCGGGGQSTESAVGGAGGPLSGASIRAVLQGSISMETKTVEKPGEMGSS